MSDKLVQVMTSDLTALSADLHDCAAELQNHKLTVEGSPETGMRALNLALGIVIFDIRTFQNSLAKDFDLHATNLDKVAKEYEKVETSMRELFEDLQNYHGDGDR